MKIANNWFTQSLSSSRYRFIHHSDYNTNCGEVCDKMLFWKCNSSFEKVIIRWYHHHSSKYKFIIWCAEAVYWMIKRLKTGVWYSIWWEKLSTSGNDEFRWGNWFLFFPSLHSEVTDFQVYRCLLVFYEFLGWNSNNWHKE